jgi:metallo-beta-lactamase family protein
VVFEAAGPSWHPGPSSSTASSADGRGNCSANAVGPGNRVPSLGGARKDLSRHPSLSAQTTPRPVATPMTPPRSWEALGPFGVWLGRQADYGAQMDIKFVGACQTVTGSMHLVRTEHGTILLDCGMFQGRRRQSYDLNCNLPLPVDDIVATVLSHAHIDHSGTIPLLVKRGYKGPIYTTPATRDLATVMLADSASIQEQDARYLNRRAKKKGLDVEPAVPLYDEKDVLEAIGRFHSVPYGFPTYLTPHVKLTFLDAGHVLGSAIVILDIEEQGRTRRVVFTGDLGRVNMPILEDPVVPENAEVLIMESTYGDRLHDDIGQMDDELADVVARTHARGGKVIIPSFALERAQELVYALRALRAEGRLPSVPVYVDSPLTVRITDVFKLHPECYDQETRELLKGRSSPFEFPELRYTQSVDDSKAIVADKQPMIVISASGMCEVGRICHHLRSIIEDDKNTVLIVGYQAQHTLGRRLVEKRRRVKIFGVERDRRAEVVVLNGFSAHADQHDLLDYATQCREKGGKLKQIALVHGDLKPQKVLADKLSDLGFERPIIPESGDTLAL